MRLISRYRRKILLPIIIVGIFFAAFAVLLQILLGPEGHIAIILFVGLYGLCLLITIIRMLVGRGSKGFRKYAMSLSPEEQDALCRQFDTGLRFYQAVLTDNCIVLLNQAILDAIPYSDILWIYEAALYNTSYANTTRTITIVTDDKKKHNIPMRVKDLKNLRAFLDGIIEKNPGIVIGYNDKMAKMLKSDVEAIKAQVIRKRDDELQALSPISEHVSVQGDVQADLPAPSIEETVAHPTPLEYFEEGPTEDYERKTEPLGLGFEE